MPDASHPALAALRDLERQDELLGAALAEVARLEDGADEVGSRAAWVAAFLAAAPAEADRLARAVAAREADAAAAAEAHAAAEELARAAAEAQKKEAPALLLAAAAAADSVRAARDAAARARVALDHHREEESAARLEAPLLEERAAALAAGLARLPRLSESGARPPGAGLAGVVEWRSRARAGLLVVRGALARERDEVLREATETAAVTAPGVVAGPTVASIRAQLEQALSPAPTPRRP